MILSVGAEGSSVGYDDGMILPRYDRQKSYQWNYENAPEPVELEIPQWPGDVSFCGFRLQSPLGVPAGPLLNGKWCLYYSSLGFDFVTIRPSAVDIGRVMTCLTFSLFASICYREVKLMCLLRKK